MASGAALGLGPPGTGSIAVGICCFFVPPRCNLRSHRERFRSEALLSAACSTGLLRPGVLVARSRENHMVICSLLHILLSMSRLFCCNLYKRMSDFKQNVLFFHTLIHVTTTPETSSRTKKISPVAFYSGVLGLL